MTRSFGRIAAELSLRHPTRQRGTDWIGVRVAETPVVVKLGRRGRQPCLVIAAGIAHAGQLPPQTALEYNADAERTVGVLAHEAAHIRGLLPARPSCPAPFSGYVE